MTKQAKRQSRLMADSSELRGLLPAGQTARVATGVHLPSPRNPADQAAYALLTFDGAVEHDPAVGRWFESKAGELGDIARHWFSQLRSCGPDVLELVHDGCPVAVVGNAPFGYVNAFRSHVNVGFFHGAALPDPARILEGDGKYMRHVKLRPACSPDVAALQALVVAAYEDVRARVRAASRAGPPG